MRVLVTGASGFVGSRLCQLNDELGHSSKRVVIPYSVRGGEPIPASIDTVVYLSGLTPQGMQVDDSAYYHHNHQKPMEFAESVQRRGVSHFLFVSTVKVYGDGDGESVYRVDSPCKPADAYGESKLRAERDLLSMDRPGFAVSVVRPPMVYGPGVKGNFINLMRLADTWYPLPFAGRDEARSMVFVDNLIALCWCIIDKNQKGVFVAGEVEPVTMDRLVGTLREMLGRKQRLFRLGDQSVRLIRKWKPAIAQRLFDGFQIDTRETNEVLGFTPPVSFREGIETTVDWYRQRQG